MEAEAEEMMAVGVVVSAREASFDDGCLPPPPLLASNGSTSARRSLRRLFVAACLLAGLLLRDMALETED